VSGADRLAIPRNTRGEVITTTMREENHQVSRASVHGCGNYDVRACCDERYNPDSADQDRRLTIEWTTDLGTGAVIPLLPG
jgi:hypothetical protein